MEGRDEGRRPPRWSEQTGYIMEIFQTETGGLAEFDRMPAIEPTATVGISFDSVLSTSPGQVRAIRPSRRRTDQAVVEPIRGRKGSDIGYLGPTPVTA